MRYAEVCAGIHASGLAWPGWECAWVSEIDPFACAVLAERHPGVPNLGDMTKITDEELAKHGPIDLLMGGTPCQSFSVAGLRKGLADPRGNLALAFLALAHRTHARWLVWENVPGVLSSTSHDAPDPRPPEGGVAADPRSCDEAADAGLLGEAVVVEDEYDADEVHAFACLLAGLQELGYGFAYASLDAQFFGLAQRRERVFLVAHLGEWTAPAAVLLEPACLRGDPPPSREAGEVAAGTLAARATAGGGLGTDFDLGGGLQVAATIDAAYGQKWGLDNQHVNAGCPNFVPVSFHITQDPIHGDVAPAMGQGNSQGCASLGVVYPLQEVGKRENKDQNGAGIGVAGDADPMYTLQAGAQHGVAVTAPCLRSNVYNNSDPGMEAQMVVPFDTTQMTSALNRSLPKAGDPCHPLAAGAHPPAMAFQESQLGCREYGEAGSLRAHGPGHDPVGTRVREGSMVRRLTPTECERLQGFPDGWTAITYRGKPAADGPRYRALGNSIAVPCLAWIGRRLEIVDAAFLKTRGGR